MLGSSFEEEFIEVNGKCKLFCSKWNRALVMTAGQVGPLDIQLLSGRFIA